MSNSQKFFVAVIDDNAGVRKSLGRLLKAAHLHPLLYCSAEAFLADSKCLFFHCLVIDIQLPGISGLELSEKLAALGCDTPIIFNTGQDNPELRRRAEALGCAGFFLKVLPSDDLLAAISRAVGSSL